MINHLVALQAIRTRKMLGNYSDIEVASAIPGAGMAGVQMALILDLNRFRPESGCKSLANLLCAGQFAQGNTRLNGFTTTRWYTPATT